MLIQLEEANAKLRSGEFETSKQIFSSLLDEDPENLEFIVGFYISSYWDNRIEKIFAFKEGKERGHALNNLFNQFELDFQSRGYPKNSSFQAVLQSVLTESCVQIRKGFHEQGRSVLDKETVWLLCRNLVRIKDYPNAIEMIDFCKRYQEMPPEFYYYKAECLFHIGETQKSRILFRSCMLNYPEHLPIYEIRSEPLHTAIYELKERFEDLDQLKEYLPIYCIERGYLLEIPNYTREDVNHLFYEMNRIEESFQKANEELKFKLKCRLLHLGLTIIDTFHAQINSELMKKTREKLMQLDAGVLERRDTMKRNKEKVQ